MPVALINTLMEIHPDHYNVVKKPKPAKGVFPNKVIHQKESGRSLEESHYWPPVIRLTPRIAPANINRKVTYFDNAWLKKSAPK